MVAIQIEVDDALYEKFSKLCELLENDALVFLSDGATAEM